MLNLYVQNLYRNQTHAANLTITVFESFFIFNEKFHEQ